jgi:glucan phosphoethanolaminetransferase (alkaline phosphatase superfamily)
MSVLLRPRNLFVVLSYVLLSCTPFMARLFGHPVAHPGAVLGIELVCWTGIWALFKRPAYFHWLLLPAFLAAPVELYLYAFYGQGISTHHLGIIFETSPAEAMEFLGSKVWLLIGVFIGVVAWFIASWAAAWRTRDLDWNDVSRPVVLAVLLLAAAVFGYGLEFGIAPPAPSVAGSAHPAKPAGKERRPQRIQRQRRTDRRPAARQPAAAPRPAPARALGATAVRPGQLFAILALRPGGARPRLLQGTRLPGGSGPAQRQLPLPCLSSEARRDAAAGGRGDRRILALRPLEPERLRARDQSAAC